MTTLKDLRKVAKNLGMKEKPWYERLQQTKESRA